MLMTAHKDVQRRMMDKRFSYHQKCTLALAQRPLFIHEHKTTYATTSSACRYLRSDGRGCYMGGRAVLGGRHAAVFLLLILLFALYAFVFRLPARRAVGGRRERRRRRRQVFQLVSGLLHLHHCVAQKIDGVRQRRQDELKALLGGESRRGERQGGGRHSCERNETPEDKLNQSVRGQ